MSSSSVNTVDLTAVLLGKFHEDDRAFRNNCIHNQSREDDDEHRAEAEAKVALSSLDIAAGVLEEELESLTASKTTVNIFLQLLRHVSCVCELAQIV